MSKRITINFVLLLFGGILLSLASGADRALTAAAGMAPEANAVNHGPDTILLDMLEGEQKKDDFFGPVPFNHEGHAGMVGSCTVCHHYTPEGQDHPECRSCHEPQLLREDIRKPSLKGAYHRQCMGCHREWAHGDHCQMCHLPNGEPQKAAIPTTQFYMANQHPPIAKPDVKVYETEHHPGAKSTVVFRHQDHIERYGNACVDCHQNDSCSRCHDGQEQPDHQVKFQVQHRESCSACHLVDDEAHCESCHQQGEPNLGPFNHDVTGWPLESYHQNRSCRDCHREPPFTALDTDCSACHPAAAMTVGDVSSDSPVQGHPHDAWYDHIQRTADDDLCLVCHPGLDKGSDGSMHPLGPMDRTVPETLLQAGARVTDDAQQLTCLVCHSTATNRFAPITVADGGPDGLCLTCHPQEAGIYGTLHDIRYESISGADPGEDGPQMGTCRTCHPAHKPARAAAPTKGDPEGLCTACHQPRSWGQANVVGEHPHPDTVCSDCHNPHEAVHGRFLAKSADELCRSCHPQQAKLTGGPHDATRQPEAWPDRQAAARGACLACHLPHGDPSEGLLRLTGQSSDHSPDSACLTCHPGAGWDSKSEIEILHPRQLGPEPPEGDAGNKEDQPTAHTAGKLMNCATCHDPHGGAEPGYLARTNAQTPSGMCLECHQEKKYIDLTDHSLSKLVQHDFDTSFCRPCHATHARREETFGQMLSPRFLISKTGGADKPDLGSNPCLACHRADGPAPQPALATHPHVVTASELLPDDPGYLPLYDAAGQVSPDGQITCRTCHLSHGQLELLKQAAADKKLSERQRGSMRMNLRPFVVPNICTDCHGPQARFRFLFFHDARQRGHDTSG